MLSCEFFALISNIVRVIFFLKLTDGSFDKEGAKHVHRTTSYTQSRRLHRYYLLRLMPGIFSFFLDFFCFSAIVPMEIL